MEKIKYMGVEPTPIFYGPITNHPYFFNPGQIQYMDYRDAVMILGIDFLPVND